ncbi:MAG: hypothetical protein H0V82_11035 [Candidatus Protochlamydia sp.]|nr:hypothetical protein [Candidatus Protochlamydia sp.]
MIIILAVVRKFSLGEIQKNQFVNGNLQGEGRESWRGKTLKGRFENDKLVNGTVIEKNWRVCTGTFENGHLMHRTITELPIRSYILFGEVMQARVFSGVFENGLLHGQGRKIDQYGRVEEGAFEKGRLVRGQVS